MNKIFTLALLCLGLLFSGQTLAQQAEEQLRIEQPDGKPKFVKFTTPQSVAAEVLLQEQLNLQEKETYRLMKASEDQLNQIHEKYQQYYDGIKVEFGTYRIHKDGSGRIMSVNGQYEDIIGVNTKPGLSPDAALQAAINEVGARQYMWDDPSADLLNYEKPKGELVIMKDDLYGKNAQPTLAYKFDIFAKNPMSRANVYVNAQTGEIILQNSKIHHADAVGSGQTRYSGTKTITTDSFNGGFRLRDNSRGQGIETYDMNMGINYNNAVDFVDNDNNWTAGEWNNAQKDNAALDAHWGAEMTYDYFFQTFNRNSFDNNGAAIQSFVHFDLIEYGYPSNDNAFWNGSVMTYGDGTQLDPLTTLDIAAHEIGHAVCTWTADLVYQRESGAMNEGFSDIWAACVENFAAPEKNTWVLGEDLGITVRSLENPKVAGQPDTYGGSNWINPNCGIPTNGNDYCGVHTNSGVLNHWFYILSQGKTGTNDIGSSYSVSGIGISNAASIAYRLESVYLGSNSDYSDARTFGIQAAEDIFGPDSPEVIATTNAWYAVGIGSEYSEGGAYCSSQGANANFEWIAGVDIGSFTNNSGGATYTDFTSQTVSINTGSTPVSLTPGFSGQVYNEYWKIWIDLNGDKDFEDANELVFDAGGMSTSTVSGSLFLPSSAAGVTTTMRVSMKYNGAQTPCETFDYGEVEDYTVAIGGTGGDTESPTAPGNLSASNITSSGFDIDWSASTDNIGVVGYDVYLDGSFDGTTTNTSYSFGGLTASTSYDVDVIARDAADNESPSSSILVVTSSTGGGGSETLFTHYFETGWDGWSDGGSDCYRYNGGFSWEGNYSIRIRDNSGTASAMTSSAYNISSYDLVELTFYFYPNSMENGEDFWVRYNDGSGWTTVASYASGSSFNNGGFYVATVTLNSSQYNLTSNARFRFQCDASANGDQIYIDEVSLTGINGSGVMSNGVIANTAPILVGSPNHGFIADLDNNILESDDGITLYPNPARNNIKLFSMEAIKSIEIYEVNGARVNNYVLLNESEIDISALKPGMYFIRLETEEETTNGRFIKQ